MQTSARNQFPATVQQVVAGPINTEVTLALAGGQPLVAVVTQASALALGLVPGAVVVAVVKAPWVMVVAGHGAVGLPAHNRLAGTVTALQRGPVNSELAITLPGGTEVHAVITTAAVVDLGLQPGAPAQALIKPSQVVLAVAG